MFTQQKLRMLWKNFLMKMTKNSQTNPISSENKEANIDWSFIRSLEGFETKGYVPKETNERVNRVVSGVTIGSGFDLGQHRLEYLKELNLSKNLIKKLKPYIGLKGKEAEEKLKHFPLVLTETEANAIDKAVKKDKALELIELYNKHTEGKIDFYSLDKAVQTVIMSVAFQYGNLPTRTPNFWKVVTSGDWERAVWHLENFGDSYRTRRRKEAKLLRNYLKQRKG